METPFAKAAKRAGDFRIEPMTEALPFTPRPCRYWRINGAMTEAEPASARPKPSRMDLRPNSITSAGMSAYFVFTMNSETYLVSPGALGKGALSAAARGAAGRGAAASQIGR